MKIIFLDIDGVLNCSTTRPVFGLGYEGWAAQIDKDLVTRLNHICAATGAKCVLSSTWRFAWAIDEMLNLLQDRAFLFDLIDCTPVEIKDRAAAIRAWLSQNKSVKKWVALDDDDLSEFGDNWVNVFDGLADSHVDEAIDKLGLK